MKKLILFIFVPNTIVGVIFLGVFLFVSVGYMISFLDPLCSDREDEDDFPISKTEYHSSLGTDSAYASLSNDSLLNTGGLSGKMSKQ